MYSSLVVKTVLASIALMSTASASETHRIEVGNGGLMFKPNRTNAAVGDVVEFVFFPKNHSVAQSTFMNPCESTTGFYSGFMPVMSGQGMSTFRVSVNDTKPLWFYCSQAAGGGHCAHGMVGCVNCPATGNTIEAYARMAMNTTNATVTQPPMMNGGVMGMNMNGSMSSSAGSDATTMTMSSASTDMMSSMTSTASSSATSSASSSSSSGAAVAVASGAAQWPMMGIAAGLGGLAFLV